MVKQTETQTEAQIAADAKKYHEEVAAVSANVVKFFKRTFANAHIEGPKLNAEEIQKSPVMFVGAHRSHCDYFYIGSNFCLMGFKNIRFAAGDNLTKLPWIGPRFLNFGAFAVSRDSGFERNYVRNLCAKVVEMLESGDSIVVFPEGGRSYTGSMLELRGGILNAALILQAKDLTRDVFLIPSTVSYETPPDVPWFPLLVKGKKLRKKNNNFIKRMLGDIYYFGADIAAFTPFMIARHFKRTYGNAYMDYCEPVSIKSLVDLEAHRIKDARDEFAAHRASLEIVEKKMHEILFSLYRILPIHAVAHVLKNGSANIADMERAVSELKDKLNSDGRNCKTLNELTSAQIVEHGLKLLRKLNAVKIKKDNVTIRKPFIIDYYAAAT